MLDTDYSESGLVCTCQDINLLFTFAHRRSCSILHRDPQADNALSSARLKSLLNRQVDDASHDFDQIKHEDCKYGDDSGFNINVDKILGQGESGEVTITDENYDLYYGDYEAEVEILSSDEVKEEAIIVVFLIQSFRLKNLKRNSQTKQSSRGNFQQ